MQMITKNLDDVARELKKIDYSVILTHQYPDGDTVGSAFALCYALRKIGKHANVIINGNLDKKFSYLMDSYQNQDFVYRSVISVDIAATQLLGDLKDEFVNKIDICIDHHAVNDIAAKLSYVNPAAAANAENIFELIKILDVDIDKPIANALYTGICTDTGCFKFSNVTSQTLRYAAELVDLGCDSYEINRIMFDTKSMARIRLEKAVLESLTLHADGKIAVINTTLKMETETGVGDTDMDGIASIPRQIEGVVIGVTIKEKADCDFKVSIRSLGNYDASKIAVAFGGGGHHAAAGCSVKGNFDDVKKQIISVAESEIKRAENL